MIWQRGTRVILISSIISCPTHLGWAQVGDTLVEKILDSKTSSSDVQAPPTVDLSAEGDESYKLGPNDEIEISVLEAPEFSKDRLRVGADGSVNLAPLGAFPVSGLSIRELEAEVTRRLKRYIRDPHVTIRVVEFRSQPVSVLGAVARPGLHEVRGKLTLLEVLSLAGGLRDDASNVVTIIRSVHRGTLPLPGAKIDESGQFSIATVDIAAVTAAKKVNRNIVIQPHDVIAAAESNTEFVYVVGEVNKAGSLELGHRKEISILEALALSGGFTEAAKPKHARILRTVEGATERREIMVNAQAIMKGKAPDQYLQVNDILFIPKTGGKGATRAALEAAMRIATGWAIFSVR